MLCMKALFFSDVHGDFNNLERFLWAAELIPHDKKYCLGDIVHDGGFTCVHEPPFEYDPTIIGRAVTFAGHSHRTAIPAVGKNGLLKEETFRFDYPFRHAVDKEYIVEVGVIGVRPPNNPTYALFDNAERVLLMRELR